MSVNLFLLSSGKRSDGSPRHSVRTQLIRRLPLVLMCSTSLTAFAYAQEIDSTVTNPVLTSTFDNGSPGDVTITEDGAIEGSDTDGFVAVTIDSNNSVTNEGDIEIEDGNGTTGILLIPGFSGTVINNGTISVSESYERTDTDDDDDLDGPYAQGSGRFGILLEDGGSFTGDIITGALSSISVVGNDSAAIALRSALTGDVTLDGTLSIVGDNAIALDVTGDVTGNILVSGGVTAKGVDATGVNIGGKLTGGLIIDSAVTSSGFDSLTNSNYVLPTNVTEDTPDLEDRLDAEVLLDNKAGVLISGSVSSGILFNGSVDTFISEEDEEDETKDTIDDFDENRGTATISSYGSGPAVLISADQGDQTGDLVIGGVVEQIRDTRDDDEDEDTSELLAEFSYEQGLINRGVIRADGLNVGFAATAVRIEGEQNGPAQTIISGGILNSGSVTALSFEADATGFSFGRGASIGSFLNTGSISATTYTTDGHTAAGVLLEDGSNLTSFENTGSITARAVGRTGDAVAIRDLGSSLTEFTNMGTIRSYHTADGTSAATTGRLIAVDFSAHTGAAGVTFLQDYQTPVDDRNGDGDLDTDDVVTPSIIGDVLFGAGNDVLSLLAGSITGDLDFGVGDSILTVENASFSGDVFTDTGQQTFALSAAEYTGDMSFKDSTASLILSDGSDFTGRLITTDTLLSVAITDSNMFLNAGNASQLTSFSITGASELTFQIDPDNTSAPVLTVSGNAEIGDAVTITPILTSLPDALTKQTLIAAGSLDFMGDFNDVELSGVPWLYTTELEITEGDVDTLDLTFTRKTAEELGFNLNEAAAYEALIDLFEKDDDLGAAISSLTTEQEFNKFYNLLIPQQTDASTRFLEVQSNAAFGALDQALETASLAAVGNGLRYWAQEYFVGLEQDAQQQSPGYNGDGFGVSLGVDRKVGTLDAVGLMIGFTSGEFEEKTGGNNPVSTTSFGVGTYVQEAFGPVDLRLAGLVSRVGFDTHRDIEFSDSQTYNVEAEWNGWSAALSGRASSEFELGPIYLKPSVTLDWFRLSQDGYTESGGDDLLEATISSVDTDRLTASGILALGKDWKTGNGFVRAELRGGYRNILSSTPYEADVRYAGSEKTFRLTAFEEQTNAVLFGASLIAVGDLTTLNFGYDMESSDAGMTHFVGATVRVTF